jgi:hypothetical protein
MIFIFKFFHGKTPKQAVLIKKIKLDFVQKKIIFIYTLTYDANCV